MALSKVSRPRVRLIGVAVGTAVAALLVGLVAAPAHAADTDPFSIVVIPDTQNYTYANRQAYIDGQYNWILSSRASLNTAFVVHLGDLVSEYQTAAQWQSISSGLKKLDDAGVPNSVIPGNHDFDNTTRLFPEYNAVFPVSRYSQASWNSPTASYGGYLGQNQFGPDGVDRENMDSYSLLTAGGHDFLILNLEFEAPAYSLAWADRVLAAYPARTVIMVTHSFINIGGVRRTEAQSTGGTPPSIIWSSFVYTHCQIRMVLSGHEHNGDIGEALRTDANQCGQPVDQMLSDYQDRANGGNGWLRYLTFDPVAGTVAVKTYSPALNQYETDADSQFTLPFQLSGEPPAQNVAPVADVAVLSQIGRTVNVTGLTSSDIDGTIASYAWDFGDGGTATGATPTHTYAADGTYTLSLTVTDDDGAPNTKTTAVTVSTAAPPPAPAIASDTFTRTGSNGWGTADVGGAWVTPSGANLLTVANGTGVFTLKPNDTREAGLASTLGTNTITDVQVAANVVPVGGAASATVIGRLAGSANYAARVRFEPGGVLRLYLLKGETSLNGGGYVAPGTYAAGQVVNVRLSVRGINPTSVQAKIWKVGVAEPATWQSAATDSAVELQKAGIVTMRTSLSGSATTPSVQVMFDNLSVSTGATSVPPPANVPPVARFTSTASGLALSVNGVTSTDSDGAIVSYAWVFGTSGSGTGVTSSYTFPGSGTYPVTLTVTDGNGATNSVTQNITVTAPPPPPPVNVPPVARFTSAVTGLALSVDGTTSSDSDGTVASYAWTFGSTGTGAGVSSGYTFTGSGTYPVTLTVTDDQGATNSVTQNITVTAPPPPPPANVPPVARFTSSASGLSLSVNGTTSSDSDGTIASYAWTFGTTGTGSGTTSGFTFPATGTYPVTLTVTDGQGATNSVTQNISVTAPPPPPPANVPPVARFTSSASGLSLSVNGTTSSDSDGTIASYAWTFGTTGTGSGTTSGFTFPATGTYPVTLTVTDNQGATNSVTQNITVTAPPPPPPPSVLANDAFARTVANGWGTADTGGAWTATGVTTNYSVANGVGIFTLRPNDTREARLDSFSTVNVVVAVKYSSDIASAGGAASLTLIGREVGASNYAARVRLEAGGVIRMYLLKDETALGTYVLPGNYVPGQQLNVKVSVTGTSPTTVRGKVWVVGTTEPAAWQATGTDSTSAMQTAGKVGVRASVSASSTNPSTVLRFDDFSATAQ